ncbi:hypothetical protein [Aestuariispira insulae]|uniref:Uncharacterized protein n=1 Tax=Aestuariispira insulae TaxID=1461337 RepID=A0A3D9H6A6_9PROT|nr:hypothetical protein [Aestuariispira insulae]RED45043.1 hypothetical protein DFP90_11236 [Aestuariispira insulae]
MGKRPDGNGYWIPVIDQESAFAAVRMAGLPVLALGFYSLLAGLLSAVSPELSWPWVMGYSVIGLLFVLMAFRMRAGRAGWSPVALGLMVLLLLLNLAAVILIVTFKGWFNGTAGIVIALVFPVLFLVLALNGFIGWRQLKRLGTETGF